MTKQKLHRRYLIDGTTENGALPNEYRKEYIDKYDSRLTLDALVSKMDTEYTVEGWSSYYDHENHELVFGDRDEIDTDTDRWSLSNEQALVNPYWVDNPSERPRSMTDPVWSLATRTYTAATPDDLRGPLVDQLEDEDIDVFGQLRLTRDGGTMHMDLFFEDDRHKVEYDEMSQTLGISTGHDYYGGTRQYAEVIALDTDDDLRKSGHHVLRGITDPKKRKHTGDAPDEIKDWWTVVLETTEKASETLFGVVTDAMAYEIDIGSLPCTIEEFLEHLGLPNGRGVDVAENAAQRALDTVEGGYDAYHLHRASMHALEDEYDGKDTRTFVNYTANANDLLFNPALAERKVVKSILDEIDEEQTTFADGDDESEKSWGELENDRERLTDRVESISEGVDAYKTGRERLTTMLTDAQDAAESEAEA